WVGLPENRAGIPIVVTLQDNAMHTVIFSVPAVFRWTDAVRGERMRSVDVVPEVTANLGAHVYLFPDTTPRPVTVWMRNFGADGPVSVRLVTQNGWTAEPASQVITVKNKGDEARATFNVTPPKGETIGMFGAQIELASGKKINVGITDIDYPHFPPQRVFGDAFAKLVRVNVRKVGTRIGYIAGAGDEVPQALRQVGYDVTMISDDDLDRGDFAKYDAIVTGVRAYNARPRMKLAHARLMEYVKNGGTLVVQYNSLSPQPLLVDPPGPYPFKVTNDRVTVEEAPVTILNPAHPLL